MSRHAGMRLAVHAASSTSAGTAVVKLKVGDSIRSARRRFTAQDVAAYAAVTGDRNPVRLHLVHAGPRGPRRARRVHPPQAHRLPLPWGHVLEAVAGVRGACVRRRR